MSTDSQRIRVAQGHRRGPITRLVSPTSLGRVLKPFVFLDLFEATGTSSRGFPWHPHSGIATISLLLSGQSWAQESTGERHSMHPGDVEFVRAGGGIWHTGGVAGPGPHRGIQLWVALPPELEGMDAEAIYISADSIPRVGAVRVIAGTYLGASGPAPQPSAMTLLDVNIGASPFLFAPVPSQTVAFFMPVQGRVRIGQHEVGNGQLAFSEDATRAVELTGTPDARIIIGTARKHPHNLEVGPHSVHTSRSALRRGQRRILCNDNYSHPSATTIVPHPQGSCSRWQAKPKRPWSPSGSSVVQVPVSAA